MNESNNLKELDISYVTDELEGYGIFKLDLSGNIESWNSIAERIKGYQKHEVLGKNFSIFFTEEDLTEKKPQKLIQTALENKKAQTEGWRIKKDGSLFWAKTTLKCIYNTQKEPIGFLKITRDLTEQQELKRSNQRGKIFVQQTPHAMAMFDLDMKYLAASEKWKKDYRLENIDLIGKSHYDIFPEIGDDWKKIHQECLKGAINICEEAKFERSDGSVQWLKWDVRPWFFSEQRIGGILMYTADITEEKKIQQALKISERQFKGSFENSAIGMAIVSLEGNWIEVNKMLCDILGYTEKEFITKTFQDITHPDDLEKDLELLKETIAGKRDNYKMEKRYFHKNGDIIWATLSVSLVRDEDDIPLHFISVIENITNRKKAEKELIQLNGELRAILDSTHVSIISTTTEGIITHFNKGAELLLGYSADEMISKETPQIIHVEEEVVKRGKELTKLLNKNVQGFDVFVELVKQGTPESREWTYVRKDKSTLKVQLLVTAIKNQQGLITGFLGVAVDITSLKESQYKLEASKAELEVLAGKLTAQNKKLLEFAHITSHNLRSPVSNLHALVNIYQTSEDQQTKNQVFDNLKITVNNLTDTLDQLMASLKVQRDADVRLEPINIKQYIEKITSSIGSEIAASKANIQTDLSGFSSITYNRVYFESILQNLLTNAIRYRSPERTPEILIKTEIKDGKHVLSVKDNGRGIDLKKHGHKLFGLYKTLHRHKDSRGVGLFITKTQVETMGGEIYVESNLDEGSIFYIIFD